MTLVNAETGEIVSVLDPEEARKLTEAIKGTADSLYLMVVQAHERQAHRALGYDSWAEYCRAEFDYGRSRSYQFLDQAKVIGELTAAAGMSTSVDITEAAARDVKGDLPALTERIAERTATEVAGDEPDEIQTETKRRIIEEEVERTRRERKAPGRNTTGTWDGHKITPIAPPDRTPEQLEADEQRRQRIVATRTIDDHFGSLAAVLSPDADLITFGRNYGRLYEGDLDKAGCDRIADFLAGFRKGLDDVDA